jgi:hypothetical protein
VAQVLERLMRLRRSQVFALALVLALLGLFVPGVVGGLLLAMLATVLAVLLRHTWSVTASPTRLARLIVLVALATLAAAKIGGFS